MGRHRVWVAYKYLLKSNILKYTAASMCFFSNRDLRYIFFHTYLLLMVKQIISSFLAYTDFTLSKYVYFQIHDFFCEVINSLFSLIIIKMHSI